MKKITIIILFCLHISVFGQNHQRIIDSLEIKLPSIKDDTSRVNALNLLSLEYITLSKCDTAMQYAVQAKSLSEKISFDKGLASSLRRIGMIYTVISAYPEALDFFLKSLLIYEKIKNQNGIRSSLNSIGIIYSSQKKYDKALTYFYAALPNNPNKAYILNMIGQTHYFKEDYSLALEYFMKSLKIAKSLNDKSQIADEFNNIGSVYEQKGDYQNAIQWYSQALSIMESLKDKYSSCSTLGGIGDVYLKQNKYDSALFYQNRSLDMAREIGSLAIIRDTEHAISKIYEQKNNCSLSLVHYKKYIEMKDSILNEGKIQKFTRTEMNFEFDKQQAIEKAKNEQISLINEQKIRQQRTQRNIFIGGFLLVAIFSLLLFRSFMATKKAKAEVEIKSKEITDNIHYAKRIQDAIMPSSTRISELFPNSFIFNRGRDIVSGDFYFAEKISDDKIIFAVADSTSHGVSGSMMVMLNSTLLNEAVRNGIHTPSRILDYVNKSLAIAFHQTGEGKEIKDGMDISLCSLNTKTMVLEFAGAYNPLIIIRNKEIIELGADKLQLGQSTKDYSNQEFQLHTGDMIFLSSDGFPDQFGGLKDKKYKYKNFTALLSKISDRAVNEQKGEIISEFDKWKGNREQTDDVLVFGIKI